MASINTQVDYLWKKLGYGVAETSAPTQYTQTGNIITATTPPGKQAYNESITSPLPYPGEEIWTEDNTIPAVIPGNSTPTVTVYQDAVGGVDTVECVADNTSPLNLTWKTNLNNWITFVYGATYVVKAYVAPIGCTTPQTSTQILQAGSSAANNDGWFFDYQAGLLNFNGSNVPASLGNTTSSTGNVVYISGARYVGLTGVTNLPSVSVVGNINAGNIITLGTISASGNINGDYFLGNGSQLSGISTTANANALTGNTLSSNVVNSSLTSVGILTSLSVSGNATLSNITIVDTTFSSTGNLIAFAGTGGIVLPAGNTAQRPASATTGTTRFNTTVGSVETWNGAAWVSGGNVVAPGSITNQQFTGDGANVTFPLDQSTTTTGVLVSINGVWQQPSNAYNVTGNSITFTAQPNTQDVIDVRFISYLTSVSYLSNDYGNSSVSVTPYGNILFTTANNTFATMTSSSFDINYPVSASGNVTIGGLLTSPPQTKAANATGSTGQICWDANYIYVCTATNTWKRVLLTGGY